MLGLFEPLRVDHAAEMVTVLADPALYAFTGGSPPSVEELSAGYARQVLGGPPNSDERWLNWVLRLRDEDRLAGYVQATVHSDEASVAWIVGTADQGRGLATEAAGAVVEWLRAAGVTRVRADIHPEHAASAAVARRIGLRPTDEIVDGEVRWRG